VTATQFENGCKHFSITSEKPLTDLIIGDSIAVNGVCLTITRCTTTEFHVTAVPETLRLTNLAALAAGDSVNLERSLAMHTRIGGHYIQGHVDGTGEIVSVTADHSDALLVKIRVPAHLSHYIVNKGYIALDGMSITVINIIEDCFTITLIPHTQVVTIVKQWRPGHLINIEIDVMAKYIYQYLDRYHDKNNLLQTRSLPC
ncbi:MAG TPA: riboflavin synthase, partial [Gammaproteobacteria bacterium]|nr:riboflavin synthase [Gammaproteobacteria bacterium]